jgi:ABC-type uncharacterized transport system substrate-binding protein
MKLQKCFLLILLLIGITLTAEGNYAGKRILYIDSYHEGWPWNDRIASGIAKVLDGTGVELQIFYMDSKRNTEEEYKIRIGRQVRQLIEDWNPDAVIASDDNAAKYVIAPYFMESSLPFVFCGINWDPTIYGFPTSNVTGIIEVNLVDKMLKQLSRYSRGNRIGYLASDTYTERQDAEHYKNILGIELTEEVFVTSYQEWKVQFSELQDKVDILIVGTPGLGDFDYVDAEQFILANTSIPTGSMNEFIMPYALLGYLKVPEEFGIWSAQTALQIIDGTPPSEIPMTTNQRFELILNLKVADRLGIIFSTSLLKNAKIVR